MSASLVPACEPAPRVTVELMEPLSRRPQTREGLSASYPLCAVLSPLSRITPDYRHRDMRLKALAEQRRLGSQSR